MKKTIKKKRIKGIVVSDKMDKTIVAEVRTMKTHPKYLKKYIFSKRYKIHDGENKHKTGDIIEFVQCKPISKDKKFIVV